MIRFCSMVAAILMVTSVAWGADDRLIVKRSPHSVAVTLDRLTDVLKARGIGVVARVDHAGAAQRVGEALKPTQLLIFGNPKLGTPLMQSNRRIGLELPMKVLGWEDDGGQVWLAYVKPDVLKSEYPVSGRDDIFKEMALALEKLTDEAVKAN
jgi:uncharacterized protein (DUF302 family)